MIFTRPVEQSIQTWAEWVGCSAGPRVLSDHNGVRWVRYAAPDHSAEVEYITIEGAGHGWPGGQPVLNERLGGKPTDKLNATDVIWEFFARHPRV